MEVVFSLVGISIVLVLAIAIVFIWAIRSGQFDDMEGPAWHVVMDDDRTSAQIAREREGLAPAEDSPDGSRSPRSEAAQQSPDQAQPHNACAVTAIKHPQAGSRTEDNTNV